MEKHLVLCNMCANCDLSFPACKALASYFTVVCGVITCVSTLSHKQQNLGVEVGENTEHKMCVLIFSATFV